MCFFSPLSPPGTRNSDSGCVGVCQVRDGSSQAQAYSPACTDVRGCVLWMDWIPHYQDMSRQLATLSAEPQARNHVYCAPVCQPVLHVGCWLDNVTEVGVRAVCPEHRSMQSGTIPGYRLSPHVNASYFRSYRLQEL